MYKAIEQHPGTLSLYETQLLNEGALTTADVQQFKQHTYNVLAKAFEEAPSYVTKKSEWFDSRWDGFKSYEQLARFSFR